MKVFNSNGEHVKTVPQKYEGLNLKERFENATKKRLSDEERLELEVELLLLSLTKYEREYVADSKMTGAGIVKSKHGDDYYVAIFDGKRVKCGKEIYILSKEKLNLTVYQ